MYEWIANGIEPPPSRYPRIADGSLVPSHVDGRINRAAWNPMRGYNHPARMYRPAHVDYGARWQEQRIVDQHPDYSDHHYGALVPVVDQDNNDLPTSTLLPPLTRVPLATFVSWNLRAPEIGAEESMLRLAGGYIPFSPNTATAVMDRDSRNTIAGLYESFEDYLRQYEAATDELIEERYLLPGFRQELVDIARANADQFEP